MLAKIIRALYLYPDRSNRENFGRAFLYWGASWYMGFFILDYSSQSGPTMFLFSISIFAEFALQKKDDLISCIVHLFLLVPDAFLFFGSLCIWLDRWPPWKDWMILAMKICGVWIFVFILIRGIVSYCAKYYKDSEEQRSGGSEEPTEEEITESANANKTALIESGKVISLVPKPKKNNGGESS